MREALPVADEALDEYDKQLQQKPKK